MTIHELEIERARLVSRLASISDLRPGFLTGRFRRCGKPTCHCAREGSRGHGPSWSLTRVVNKKTVTKIIPASAVERTRQQILEFQAFRELCRQFVEVNEQLCDARLGEEAAEAEAEKKGSKKSSTKRQLLRLQP
jgi:hypothetical protein